MRYGILARLSDTAHGWLDGRRGLPHLPRAVGEPGGGSQVPASDDLPEPLPAHDSEPVPTGRLDWLMTPWITELSARAMEQIRAEELKYWDDCAARTKEFLRFRAARDLAADELVSAKERLELIQRPLTDQERKVRRLVEHDHAARLEAFVAQRRQAERNRRLQAAEQDYQASAARHAEAAAQAQLREELISARFAVAQAAARRHYEYAMRRIATYQQQLIRRHPRGADLSLLMRSHQVGPELPAWVSDTSPRVLSND
jgi:hypothetical protein